MAGLDLVARVTPRGRYEFTESRGAWSVPFGGNQPSPEPPASSPHVVAMDFGAKRNILRCLVDAGCRVTGVPANTTASEIMKLDPDGIFLSSGPGDPAAVHYAVKTIKELLGQRPMHRRRGSPICVVGCRQSTTTMRRPARTTRRP